jgi:hypothetical protein
MYKIGYEVFFVIFEYFDSMDICEKFTGWFVKNKNIGLFVVFLDLNMEFGETKDCFLRLLL